MRLTQRWARVPTVHVHYRRHWNLHRCTYLSHLRDRCLLWTIWQLPWAGPISFPFLFCTLISYISPSCTLVLRVKTGRDDPCFCCTCFGNSTIEVHSGFVNVAFD
ncbi:hypothetical protein BDV37DRAFT_266314 [Aspergillus pseudonomiae]|uniref:Uncharacterized protein n=1 Tax=Aspergillus pseudonomiae TaxID=1506151 RepID=A0A5N7CSG1_9EURO|nr:uncharacterized protein BDV37DRAFT_266314 [Aspergillus pseudonomiae]KAE8397182.1 hypothetical protein BDV37DRAFT_266314 [Aspergillus pseudonomiae]